MVCFNLDYWGSTLVDKRFSNAMVPWVIADIKRRKKVETIVLNIDEYEMKGTNSHGGVLFTHNMKDMTRFCHENNNMRTFMLLARDHHDPVLHCHLFQTAHFEDVSEIHQTLRENKIAAAGPQFRSHSSAANLTSLCNDISPSSSQFFEVLYVGKIKVSHQKVPDTFIDDALEKFRIHELEKLKKSKQCVRTSKSAVKAVDVTTSSPTDKTKQFTLPQPVLVVETELRIVESGDEAKDNSDECTSDHEHKMVKFAQDCDTSNDTYGSDRENEVKSPRLRTGSLGVIEILPKKSEDTGHNRTMLFQVGRTDLRLISPDKKQVLLHKQLKDVSSCIQGLQSHEHFGLICREVDCFVAYVFKCQCDGVADDVVATIKQSFISVNKESKQPTLSCEHCPMVWYHKLCSDIEGLTDKKTQLTILKRIECLPDEEQESIQAKFLGVESSNIKQQNEFLMILLRAHCESKQNRHVHDTTENRSEFLNQYLGGSTIFMKAKRSLTSSFDQLLKRKGSAVDVASTLPAKEYNRHSPNIVEESDIKLVRSGSVHSNHDFEVVKKDIKRHINEAEELKEQLKREKSVESNESSESKKHTFMDIASIAANNQKIEKTLQDGVSYTADDENVIKAPVMNIFLKVGSTPRNCPSSCDDMTDTTSENDQASGSSPRPSWRQAIFYRVVTPSKTDVDDAAPDTKRSKQELRQLWKKAINQQVLLIRMERENAKLRARQEEATVKRIKLQYDELSSSSKDYIAMWDMISNKDNRMNSSKCDNQMLLQSIKQGVPRAKRGEVWHFLAVQYCLKQPPYDSCKFPNYCLSYEDLLKQLTSFQHAILIDLGRTFPTHPYYSSPLGPGQLALFNLLKAYSLLDPEVGYCQGLSFVAGVLLLHMSEETAFLLLRHLMFRRGMRKQYLPDMAALQIQLYQLSRLLHDLHPQLYAHFDMYEVAPTLYAAPWMLTIFSSQFPLGFVTRVFDLLFLENPDVIFRVAMALLSEHKEQLLTCTSFEEIMEYLKDTLPNTDAVMLERVIKKVLSMDVSRQLHEYEVEYHVLQEGISIPKPQLEKLKRVELENKRLTDQNLALIEQLEVVNSNSNRLEMSRSNLQSAINKLESQVRNLEVTVSTLCEFIADVSEENGDIEVPGDIRRIISNLQLAQQRSHQTLDLIQLNKNKKDKSLLLKRSKTSMGFNEKSLPMNELYCIDDLPPGTKFTEKLTREDERDRNTNCNHGGDEVVKMANGVSKNVTMSDNVKRQDSGVLLKGVPLRVLEDDENEKNYIKKQNKNKPNSANLTSKITSGVSSFFSSSHNQIIKSQKEKNRKYTDENLILTEPVSAGKTNEAYHEYETILEIANKKKFCGDIGSLNLKDSILSGQRNINNTRLNKSYEGSKINDIDNKKPILVPKNADQEADKLKPNDISPSNVLHPLDACCDINVTYNGTTKLKSIKPVHRLHRTLTEGSIHINDLIDKPIADNNSKPKDKTKLDSNILNLFDNVSEEF